jgi:hypothetical protein
MTREEFVDWKRHPVTQSLLASIFNRIQEGREELGNTAGLDPHQDRLRVGIIRGHQDVLDGLDMFETSFVENETND